MARQCTTCGTVYDHDDADFCNACGGEDLVPLVEAAPEATRRRLRDDQLSLIVAAVLWVPGMSYVLGQRQPRTWGPLLFAWGLLTVMGIIAGLVLRNVRTFVWFAVFGALLVAVYGLVKLT